MPTFFLKSNDFMAFNLSSELIQCILVEFTQTYSILTYPLVSGTSYKTDLMSQSAI